MPPLRHLIFLPCAVALLATLPASSAMAGDGTFRTGEILDLGTSESFAVGDFNADGRPDLAAAIPSSGHVAVRLGKVGGGFTEAAPVAVGVKPVEVVAADFDADGDDDLAVGTDTKVAIRLSSRDGKFTSVPDVQLGRLVRSVAPGDFDADGRNDLAITSTTDNENVIHVSLGRADGKFAAATQKDINGGPLAVADFNSDGNQDIVHGRFGNTRSGGVLLGAGGGRLASGGDIALSDFASARNSWAVGDFNSDGNLDVVAAVTGSGAASVRFGKGDGTFATGPDVPAEGYPVAVAVGDFNSDGNDDLAVGYALRRQISVRLGDGAGSFRAAPDVTTDEGASDIAIADFDGDGNDDLAVAGYGDDTTSIHYGSGPSALDGNLLANGGFEGAGAARTTGEAPEIPGWLRRGRITFARYGLPSSAFFPAPMAAPRFGSGGSNLLWGGASARTDGITQAYQAADVTRLATDIDAGRATANLSAYLGGALAFEDRAEVRADFLPADGVQILGTLKIGPVTATDRKRLTTMLRRAGSALVPSGTRRIGVTVTSIDEDKTLSSATADNVKLTVTTTPAPTPTPTETPAPTETPTPTATSTPTPQPTATPGPGRGDGPRVGRFGANTNVTVKRVGPKRATQIRVRVANANAFAVTGTLRARVAKRAVPIRIGAKGAATVRLALTSRARRQLARSGRVRIRITGQVIDPAGTTRRVTTQFEIRKPSR